jgi:hypothetical protein
VKDTFEEGAALLIPFSRNLAYQANHANPPLLSSKENGTRFVDQKRRRRNALS